MKFFERIKQIFVKKTIKEEIREVVIEKVVISEPIIETPKEIPPAIEIKPSKAINYFKRGLLPQMEFKRNFKGNYDLYIKGTGIPAYKGIKRNFEYL